MTGFELLQVEDMLAQQAMSLFMNFVTLVSGYLIANHYIAPQLSRFQFSFLVTTYSALIILTILTVAAVMERSVVLADHMQAADITPTFRYEGTTEYAIVMLIIMIAIYVGSVIFSFRARKGGP